MYRAVLSCRSLFHLLVLVLGLTWILPALAVSDAPPEPRELIVRLAPADAPGDPTPEGVVDDLRKKRPIAGDLGIGGPFAAELGLVHRASDRLREELAANPDGPRARLERYVVLTYPPVVDLDVIADALRRNPHVEAVGVNEAADLSVVPNDSLMVVTASPSTHQWGPYELNLPQAWDYTKGHGYLGIVDTGIDVRHPDHQGLYWNVSAWVWGGGNYRPHLSYDYGQNDSNPDEGEPQGTINVTLAGHGTHVAGIAAAHSDNVDGVAGACWNCSLMIGKSSSLYTSGSLLGANLYTTVDDIGEAMAGMVDRGAQVINLSLGYQPVDCLGTHAMLCDAVAYANDRDVVVAAASGNDGSSVSDYPATDPTVLAVGGIGSSGALWSGSNYDPDQFVMPATDVLSTFYRGISNSPSGGCDDSLLPAYPGYGPCLGTSMAAPAMTGLVGLLRSVNPLVEKGQIRDLLLANLDNPPGWNTAHGHGKPDAFLAVQDALGRVDGQVLPNRLTPLFRLYSESPRDTMLTTVPQWASAARQGGLGATYFTMGRRVTGYNDFPGVTCYWSWCVPTADLYVFTTDGSPNGHPLVPLYRMSRRGGKLDHNYTTETAGILALADRGYQVDGVEGYIYQRCSPEPSCMPPGTVRLYRYYNPTLDDHALFPETDLANWTAAGYGPEAGANEWIGYVYLNQDSDGDEAIDGFELLMGTDPHHADSDCDGTTDGDEIVWFPYSDPLDGPCGGGSQVIGEVGQVTDISHLSRTVYFSRSYQNPVVFAQPLSFNGQQPAVIRITNVGTSGFTFYLQEAPDMDGPHVQETVSWVVLEAGSWQLANGVELEVGQIVTDRTLGTNVAGSWQTVTFGQSFASAPVAFSQVQTNNDPSFVKTRQLAASTISFRTALEEEEASTTYHGTETVGWMAMTPGIGTWSGKKYQVSLSGSTVTEVFTSLSFTAGFGTAPRFLATMGTRNGGNNAGIRYKDLTASGVQVKVEEDTTFDAEVAHLGEGISFLAIEGDGLLEASPR